MTLSELRALQARRRNLARLAAACAVTLAVVGLGSCGPGDAEIAGTPRSGEADRTPEVRVAAIAKPVLVDGDTFHNVTTTTVAPTTTTAPPAPTTTTPPPGTTAVAPTPQERVTPAGPVGDCGGWGDLVASYFPSEVGTACRIIMCESRGNPSAVSSTGDHGLAQVNKATWAKPGHHDPVADWIGRNWGGVYDPATNLEMARRIRSAYGWGMWACA